MVIVSYKQDLVFSEQYTCSKCGVNYAEVEPRIFSFNSPYGACLECNGLGTKIKFDPDLVIPDKSKSINAGAIAAWKRGGRGYILYYRWLIRELAAQLRFDLDRPFSKLPKDIQQAILYGSAEFVGNKPFEGVIPHLERLFRESDSDYLKEEISKFMSSSACPACKGARLKRESLAVRINSKNIWEVTRMSIKEAHVFFNSLELNAKEKLIAHQALKEIIQKLKFCIDVGLES